jgi:hypothetical protein
MMDDVRIKVELEIPKTTLIAAYMQRSQKVDGDIKRGVEEAFAELTADDNLVDLIKERVKDVAIKSIMRSCNHHDVQQKLSDMINVKLKTKLEEVSDRYVDQVTRGINAAFPVTY